MITLIFSIILSIVFICGLVALYNKIRKKNPEEKTLANKLYVTGSSVITLGVFNVNVKVFFMYVMSNTSERLKIIQYISEGSTDIYLLSLGLMILLISVVLEVYENKMNSQNESNNIKLLNIQAYSSNNLEEFDKNDYKLNLQELIYLNLCDIWEYKILAKTGTCEVGDSIKEAIIKVKEGINLYKSQTKFSKRAFMGIAPIPILIYAGSIIPKLKFSNYVEIDLSQNKLISLSNDDSIQFEKLKIRNDYKNDDIDTEVVVAVSTTIKIPDSDLIQFKNMNIGVKHIFLENTGHDKIISENQINEYSKFIMENIIKLKVEKPNLKNVHLICASKPSLVFRLGQFLDNNTQLPSIISYQQLQTHVVYPWGIYINDYNKKGQAFIWGDE